MDLLILLDNTPHTSKNHLRTHYHVRGPNITATIIWLVAIKHWLHYCRLQ